MLWSLAFFISLFSFSSADVTLQVLQPSTLNSQFPPDGTVPSSPALFGVPPAGRSMVGQVYVIGGNNPDACDPLVLCQNGQTENCDFTIPAGCEGNSCSLMYMVVRGSCNFVEKVRHVQNIGGHAALIVDNVDEPYLPFMADDGTGGDIVIPSVLISHKDGQLINTTAGGNANVLVKMVWSLPNPDGRVEWSLWSTPTDQASASFKTTFGHAVSKLGDTQQFTPHYIVLDGEVLGCTSEEVSCGDQCTNKGKYCSVDPEDDLTGGLSGKDNLEEALRQICLFQVVNSTAPPQPLLWWTYVTEFQSACIGDPSTENENTFNQDCSYKIMSKLGINTEKVKQCLDSAGGTDEGSNSLLEAELMAQSMAGVRWWPILYINKEPYYESLQCPTPMDVTSCGPLNMICGGYQDGTAPCACDSSPGCDLCQSKDNCGVCMAPESSGWGQSCEPGLSAAGVVIVVLVCFILVGFVVVYYMKNQQQKMRDDIDNLLSQYQPLDERMKGSGAQAGLINGSMLNSSDDV